MPLYLRFSHPALEEPAPSNAFLCGLDVHTEGAAKHHMATMRTLLTN